MLSPRSSQSCDDRMPPLVPPIAGSLGIQYTQLQLIGASGLPGFWSIFGLFGRFWSVSGPRGSVWPEISFVNATMTRRIYPRYPEASTIFVILTIPYFFGLFGGPLGRAHGLGPRARPMGGWAHGPGPWAQDGGPPGPEPPIEENCQRNFSEKCTLFWMYL